MRLASLAPLLALASCAATPKGEPSYELSTTVYEMPLELARELTGRETCGGLPAPLSLVERARAAAAARSDVEASSRPRIRVREGGTARIGSMSETDYVGDWTVDAQGKAHAVHAKAPDGLELELRPAAREAGLELGFRVKLCHLLRPIREADLTLSNGEQVKSQLTLVTTRELDSKATLAEGECLATLLPGREDGRMTLICVTATPVGGR